MEPAQLLTFVVRLARDDAGALTGTVTRVRSGEQHRFEGVEAISALIATMVNRPSRPGPAAFQKGAGDESSL